MSLLSHRDTEISATSRPVYATIIHYFRQLRVDGLISVCVSLLSHRDTEISATSRPLDATVIHYFDSYAYRRTDLGVCLFYHIVRDAEISATSRPVYATIIHYFRQLRVDGLISVCVSFITSCVTPRSVRHHVQSTPRSYTTLDSYA